MLRTIGLVLVCSILIATGARADFTPSSNSNEDVSGSVQLTTSGGSSTYPYLYDNNSNITPPSGSISGNVQSSGNVNSLGNYSLAANAANNSILTSGMISSNLSLSNLSLSSTSAGGTIILTAESDTSLEFKVNGTTPVNLSATLSFGSSTVTGLAGDAYIQVFYELENSKGKAVYSFQETENSLGVGTPTIDGSLPNQLSAGNYTLLSDVEVYSDVFPANQTAAINGSVSLNVDLIVTPAPSSVVLLVIGLIMLGLIKSRVNARKAQTANLS